MNNVKKTRWSSNILTCAYNWLITQLSSMNVNAFIQGQKNAINNFTTHSVPFFTLLFEPVTIADSGPQLQNVKLNNENTVEFDFDNSRISPFYNSDD
ncbi:hypothetical protein Bhyg_05042 [Pseudolycoriella hygida]|uniref:Uncharacterized protein n=1 Tax=Pseudolycoriella hygida TaxID=35572 RepID=A0A9Q0NGC6_9DIPT|nr:hypothetical protein Bhyg_05042 [Pseudolycoriella hygida]